MSRSRKSSIGGDMSFQPNRPTTFFLTRDPDSFPSPKESNLVKHDPELSPVRSLKETLEEAARQSKHVPITHRHHEGRSQSRRRSTIRPTPKEERRTHQQPSTSQTSPEPLTPLLQSRDGSLPSSPKSVSSRSIQKSDEESLEGDDNSRAIASSDEENEGSEKQSVPLISDSAPQLIMPSIKMPSRRPFTPRGKQLGRFKILVAGSKGCGRTSLIKSIVQLCEDIVHVDSMHNSLSASSKTVSKDFSVTEVYASTRPYPSWWSDVDESRILRRRKSTGSSVLERNVCFVDTTDSGKPENALGYIEHEFFRTVNTIHQPGGDFSTLLSGHGGSQVDLVMYLVTSDTLAADITAIERLDRLTNVIPLISKADLLTPDQIEGIKSSARLRSLTPSSLNQLMDVEQPSQVLPPFSVSSANGPDIDNMDASLLMSPEYVQPLMPSELASVIHSIFDPDMAACLRYTTAKKLSTWYRSDPKLTQPLTPSIHSGQPSTLHSPVQTSLSQSGQLVPITSHISLNTSNSFALAKITDHAQREEHLAQLRLSKWAADLQLSLQRERERYESVARRERALWLVQRMGEEVNNGHIVNAAVFPSTEKMSGQDAGPGVRYEIQDPLGLLQWQSQARARGWVILQLVGSFGVVGGVALWLANTWGVTSSLQTWMEDVRGRWLELSDRARLG